MDVDDVSMGPVAVVPTNSVNPSSDSTHTHRRVRLLVAHMHHGMKPDCRIRIALDIHHQLPLDGPTAADAAATASAASLRARGLRSPGARCHVRSTACCSTYPLALPLPLPFCSGWCHVPLTWPLPAREARTQRGGATPTGAHAPRRRAALHTRVNELGATPGAPYDPPIREQSDGGNLTGCGRLAYLGFSSAVAAATPRVTLCGDVAGADGDVSVSGLDGSPLYGGGGAAGRGFR